MPGSMTIRSRAMPAPSKAARRSSKKLNRRSKNRRGIGVDALSPAARRDVVHDDEFALARGEFAVKRRVGEALYVVQPIDVLRLAPNVESRGAKLSIEI